MPERERWASDAHAMIPAGDTLRFPELARLCREVETACRSGGDYAPPVAPPHGLRRSALGAITDPRAA